MGLAACCLRFSCESDLLRAIWRELEPKGKRSAMFALLGLRAVTLRRPLGHEGDACVIARHFLLGEETSTKSRKDGQLMRPVWDFLWPCAYVLPMAAVKSAYPRPFPTSIRSPGAMVGLGSRRPVG